MRERKFLGCMAALTMTLHLSAQDWTLGGNNINSTEWFGADGGSTVPLQIRHDANQPIDWYTDAIQRLRLKETATATISTFTGVGQDGFLLLSGTADAFTNTNSNAPFTRLHLIDPQVSETNQTVYAQEFGYRSWQRNGITFTGNRDHAYIGQRYWGNDQTDFVVQWADNAASSQWGTDRMKFVFTSAFNPAAERGATSENGLEAMRMFPVDLMQVNVGVGDFSQPGGGDPTERLDLLDGRLRIRELPDAAGQAAGSYRVMVVDNASSASAERGVVKWVDPAVFVDSDCDWAIENDGVSGSGVSHHVYTAVGSSDDCPDADDAVGIGVDLSSATPIAKLDVHAAKYAIGERITNVTNGASVQGLRVHVQNATDDLRGIQINTLAASNNINFGLRADVDGPTVRSRGVSARTQGATYTAYAGEFIADDPAEYTTGAIGWARNGKWRFGVEGRALGGDESYQVGVNGRAELAAGCGMMNNLLGATKVGVQGIACGLEDELAVGVYGRSVDVTNNTWAGYFDGHVNINGDASCTAMAWISDGNLKTGVEDLAGASAIIAQLQPRTYHFDAANHPLINLPSGLQRGFIAQEMEEVLPDLVSEVRIIGLVDSTGNEVVAGETVKAVNYVGLIPVLVSAMQEQNDRIAQLEQLLTACCNRPADSDNRMATAPASASADDLLLGQERLLRIAPNPFTDRTTLYCTLERGGRMQLLANSADGRDLRVLSEAQREAGEFQYEWSTVHLAPGVYYVTLLLDGDPLVKRAVKVGQ